MFRYIAHEVGHPDGFAAASWEPARWDTDHEDHLAFLQLHDDGTILFASGDAVMRYGDDGPATSASASTSTVSTGCTRARLTAPGTTAEGSPHTRTPPTRVQPL